VHGIVFKRQSGSFAWYEGVIALEEVGGKQRTPQFAFYARPIDDNGHFYFYFTHDNLVLCWMTENVQVRAWKVVDFIISFAKQLIHPLKELCDGSNASHAWQCGTNTTDEVATPEDALNCIPVAHRFAHPEPDIPEA
jgi:hypothetical protein